MSKRAAPDSPRRPRRAALVAELDLAGREVSAATVMFHAVLAERRGLSATEEKALDILLRRGPLTHRELVRETGLKPASVSDLVDRLERRGYAVRQPHPTDGRRVLIAAVSERITADVSPLFESWVRELHALYAEFSDDQLGVIRDFLREAARRQQHVAELLSAATSDGPAPPAEPDSRPDPR